MDPLAVLAEQWLAALGITVFLSAGKVRLDRGTELTVQRMEGDVRNTFKRFMRKRNRFEKRDDSDDSDFARSIEFEKLADDLFETASPEKLAQRLEGFPSDLLEPLALAASQALQYLRSKLPVTRYQSGMGLKYRDPSPRDMERFWRTFDVADAPLSVLREMEAGTLAGDMVDTLRTCYPNLYGRWQDLALQELSTDDLSLLKEKQWRVFMSTLSFNPAIAGAVGSIAAAEDEAPAPRKDAKLGAGFYAAASDKLATK